MLLCHFASCVAAGPQDHKARSLNGPLFGLLHHQTQTKSRQYLGALAQSSACIDAFSLLGTL